MSNPYADILNSIGRKLANRLGVYKGARSIVGHAAARVTRLTNSWTTQTLSADSIARNDLENLRARSRQLADENPYIIKWLSMLKTNVLGSKGMLLRMQAREEFKVVNSKVVPGPLDHLGNHKVESAWKEWGKKENCTVAKDMTWQQVNEVCLETTGRDGETLAQMLPGWSGNKFGFALRLFECDHLDVSLNKQLQNGNEIRLGVERNPWGERVAFHLRKKNPNDNYYGQSIGHKHERIPAKDIVHPYLVTRIMQTRGLPHAHGVMGKLNMLDGYEEAELVRSRVDAAQGGWFTNNGESGMPSEKYSDGNTVLDVEPGQWKELPPWLTPVPSGSGHPNANYDDYEARLLRTIAAGLGASYNVLAEDMTSVNFSSMRMGLLEPRELYLILQSWWGEDFCCPIFNRWLEHQLDFTNNIDIPSTKLDKFKTCKWMGRRWPYMEPVKDITAARMRIEAGLSSWTKELADIGMERDELWDELADDKAAMAARGITVGEASDAMATSGQPSEGGAPPPNQPQQNLEPEDE